MKTLDDVRRDMVDKLHHTYKRDEETVVQITRDAQHKFWCVFVDQPVRDYTTEEWTAHANKGGHCGTELACWLQLDALALQAVLSFVFSGEPLTNVIG